MDLPSGAPLVRITAGVGTASQKTWNLKRPLTLIGSRRPAHIVLHDRDVSDAHCVIVNTGTDLLLKDLHTSKGTLRNKERIDLIPLEDGDVITIGSTCIQVAVRVPQGALDDSGAGLKYRDPLAMPTPVTVGLIHTNQQWEIADAVTLVGRHGAAGVRLDNEQVSRRHAVMFRFNGGPAIFDLGGQTGMMVNARMCPQAMLADGDRITIGPFGLEVKTPERPVVNPPPADATDATAQPVTIESAPDDDDDTGAKESASQAVSAAASMGDGGEFLRGGIESCWERLNTWEAKLLENSSALTQQQADVAQREEGLEKQEAALRGQLHDIARLEEQLAEREKTLGEKRTKLESAWKQLEVIKNACTKKEAELAQRTQELSRREHVVAQRWTRLKNAKCPHCYKPTGTPEPEPASGQSSSPSVDEPAETSAPEATVGSNP